MGNLSFHVFISCSLPPLIFSLIFLVIIPATTSSNIVVTWMTLEWGNFHTVLFLSIYVSLKLLYFRKQDFSWYFPAREGLGMQLWDRCSNGRFTRPYALFANQTLEILPKNPILLFYGHFTVVCLVAWPFRYSEAAVDLVSIETSLLFLCKFLLISMRTASLA